MGFGNLLIGYLITYVISITAGALGVGSLALMIGAVLMFFGIRSLCRFNTSFVFAKWLVCGVFAIALLRLWQDFFSAWFSVGESVNAILSAILTWASFAVTLLFHFALLYAIRVLSLEVELSKLSSHAMYNTLGVGIWGVLFLFCNMPATGKDLLPYLSMSMGLFNLAYLVSNAVLLLRCAKNICAEGDEEVAPKPSRFAWINRINDSYNQTMDKLKTNSRADGDAFWHNHMEKKSQNNHTNHKHKKKKK